MPRDGTADQGLTPEDALRADAYGLLASLLAGPPLADRLTALASLKADSASAIGGALAALAETAARTDAVAAEREFHELFIGLARGELLPYASYYITGFLHDRPLAALRGDLLRFGIERSDGVSEPEDHIAMLCEVMAGLIRGDLAGPVDADEQRAFHRRHLAPWAGRFFEDLEAAKAARLYKPVGRFGRLFMALEGEAFALAA